MPKSNLVSNPVAELKKQMEIAIINKGTVSKTQVAKRLHKSASTVTRYYSQPNCMNLGVFRVLVRMTGIPKEAVLEYFYGKE